MYEELKARLKRIARLEAEDYGAATEDHASHQAADAIEQLERKLAERDAEIAKLQTEADPEALHVAYLHGQADRNQTLASLKAEIAKYRDAPVICSQYQDLWGNWCLFLDEKHEIFVRNTAATPIRNLIVKPGE